MNIKCKKVYQFFRMIKKLFVWFFVFLCIYLCFYVVFVLFKCVLMNSYFDKIRHEPTMSIIIPEAKIILEVSIDCDNFFPIH